MTERHVVRDKKRSRLLKIFLLTVNLWAIYVFIGSNLFIYVPLGFTVLTLLLIIPKIISNKRQMVKTDNVFKEDTLKMSLKFFKMNRRFMIVSIIGIVLATIIISQAFILSSTYERRYFQERFGIDLTPEAIKLEWDEIKEYSAIQELEKRIDPEVREVFNTYNIEINQSQSKYRMDVKIAARSDTVEDRKNVLYFNTGIKQYNDDMLQALNQLPSVVKSGTIFEKGGTFLIFTKNSHRFTHFVNETRINLTVPVLLGETTIENNETALNATISIYDLKIDGFVVITDEDKAWTELKGTYTHYDLVNNGGILTPTEGQEQIVNQLIINKEDEWSYNFYYEYHVYVNLDGLSQKTIETLKNNLEYIVDEIYYLSQRIPVNSDFIYVYSPLERKIESYEESILGMKSALLIIGMPMISLAIFLVGFSLTLVEVRKRRLLAIMKVRGTSAIQMRAIMISELIMVASISLISGMILSIPWTLIVLLNNDISGVVPIGDLITITADWLWKLPLIAMILSLDLNISNVLHLTKVRIDEIEEKIEKNKPIWQRLNLDLIFFVLALIFVGMVRLLSLDDSIFTEILFYTVGPIAIGILLLTTPLIIARYFGELVSKVSDFLWKRNGGLFALAARNLMKNRFSSSRLAALLMLGLMLSLIMLLVPANIEHINNIYGHYYVGADIRVDGIDLNNITLMEKLRVEGVEASTEIIKIELTNELNFQVVGNARIHHFEIMAVNSTTFADVAYWDESYADKPISELMQDLGTGNRTLIPKKSMETLKLDYRDLLNLTTPTNITFTPEVVGNFNHFPNLGDYVSNQHPSGESEILNIQYLPFIVPLDYLEHFNLTGIFYQSQVYLKLKHGTNSTNVMQHLLESFADNTEISFSSIQTEMNAFAEQSEVGVVSSLIDSMFIFTIIITCVSILYFSFITLSERRREIGVFRSMGMVSAQLFKLLMVEMGLLVSFALFTGAFFGYFLTSTTFFMLFTEYANYGPPMEFIAPFGKTSVFILAVVAVSVFSAMYPVWRISKQQTGSILREE